MALNNIDRRGGEHAGRSDDATQLYAVKIRGARNIVVRMKRILIYLRIVISDDNDNDGK